MLYFMFIILGNFGSNSVAEEPEEVLGNTKIIEHLNYPYFSSYGKNSTKKLIYFHEKPTSTNTIVTSNKISPELTLDKETISTKLKQVVLTDTNKKILEGMSLFLKNPNSTFLIYTFGSRSLTLKKKLETNEIIIDLSPKEATETTFRPLLLTYPEKHPCPSTENLYTEFWTNFQDCYGDDNSKDCYGDDMEGNANNIAYYYLINPNKNIEDSYNSSEETKEVVEKKIEITLHFKKTNSNTTGEVVKAKDDQKNQDYTYSNSEEGKKESKTKENSTKLKEEIKKSDPVIKGSSNKQTGDNSNNNKTEATSFKEINRLKLEKEDKIKRNKTEKNNKETNNNLSLKQTGDNSNNKKSGIKKTLFFVGGILGIIVIGAWAIYKLNYKKTNYKKLAVKKSAKIKKIMAKSKTKTNRSIRKKN